MHFSTVHTGSRLAASISTAFILGDTFAGEVGTRGTIGPRMSERSSSAAFESMGTTAACRDVVQCRDDVGSRMGLRIVEAGLVAGRPSRRAEEEEAERRSALPLPALLLLLGSATGVLDEPAATVLRAATAALREGVSPGRTPSTSLVACEGVRTISRDARGAVARFSAGLVCGR